MNDKEILTTVTETRRSDGEYKVREATHGDYIFMSEDETLMVTFDEVSAYIEVGSEWADFYTDGESDVSICNEREEKFPHWLFEELNHIEQEGELRPIDDYETNHHLKDNRGIKGVDN